MSYGGVDKREIQFYDRQKQPGNAAAVLEAAFLLQKSRVRSCISRLSLILPSLHIFPVGLVVLLSSLLRPADQSHYELDAFVQFDLQDLLV